MRQILRPLRKFAGEVKIKLNGVFGQDPKPEKWVFIVGCYNSGTTLLHDIIATHPEVACLPHEGQYFTDQLLRPADVGLPRMWAMKPELFILDKDAGEIDVERLKRQWGASVDNPNARVILEKTTINAARMLWLQANFENAYFIGIVRDGYAVSEGIHRKAGHKLALCAQQWARSNEIMLQQFESLDRKLLIKYEELTEDPDNCLCGALEFLQLKAPRNEIAIGEWTIHERKEPIRNMNEDSLAKLSSDDIRIINQYAEPLLRRFGYFRAE